jgi:hypothetical protein
MGNQPIQYQATITWPVGERAVVWPDAIRAQSKMDVGTRGMMSGNAERGIRRFDRASVLNRRTEFGECVDWTTPICEPIYMSIGLHCLPRLDNRIMCQCVGASRPGRHFGCDGQLMARITLGGAHVHMG